MPKKSHVERHFTGSLVVRDIVIGMADGLTVPFALAAGLSAVASTSIIVTAGLAEIAAGSISMGLGGYLAAQGDIEHFDIERRREEWEVDHMPEVEAQEVAQILQGYGVSKEESATVVAALRKHKPSWLDFMMRFELGLERPDSKRVVTSAATIAGSYAAGGFIPLSPYMVFSTAQTALLWSAVTTVIALSVFGYVKARFMGTSPLRGALQTVLVGGVASALAFTIARLIS